MHCQNFIDATHRTTTATTTTPTHRGHGRGRSCNTMLLCVMTDVIKQCPYTVAVRNLSDKGNFALLYVDGQKVSPFFRAHVQCRNPNTLTVL